MTFSSPSQCAHIWIDLGDGRMLVKTLDQLREEPAGDFPEELRPVKDVVIERDIRTLEALKAEMEGRDKASGVSTDRR